MLISVTTYTGTCVHPYFNTYMLMTAGALSSKEEGAEITSLGQIMSDIALDLQLTRMIVFGKMMGCMEEAIVMAAYLSNEQVSIVIVVLAL